MFSTGRFEWAPRVAAVWYCIHSYCFIGSRSLSSYGLTAFSFLRVIARIHCPRFGPAYVQLYISFSVIPCGGRAKD
ncbi:expressed protein [Echinococcus multilocularis]|uniref:Expressed protein n=1 Tax=Echinococcus multilocularis TaxID=6211 RepID=A0A0S4MIH1_ECHMU|nr:expressed protein [Echinococcus multilocularis]